MSRMERDRRKRENVKRYHQRVDLFISLSLWLIFAMCFCVIVGLMLPRGI